MGRGNLKPGVDINAPLIGRSILEKYNSICIVDDNTKKLLDDCYDQTQLIPFVTYNPIKKYLKLPTALDFLHQRHVKDTFEYNKGSDKRTMTIGSLPSHEPPNLL